jgi:hypothetical protein
MDLDWCVDVSETDEYGKGHEMLYNEDLVAPTPNGGHRAKHYPHQHRPGSEALPRKGVFFELSSDVVIRGPGGEQVSHMDGGGKKHTSCAPTVEPVEAFVTNAGEVANNVVLASEKED